MILVYRENRASNEPTPPPLLDLLFETIAIQDCNVPVIPSPVVAVGSDSRIACSYINSNVDISFHDPRMLDYQVILDTTFPAGMT